jgi:hypothetical protein
MYPNWIKFLPSARVRFTPYHLVCFSGVRVFACSHRCGVCHPPDCAIFHEPGASGAALYTTNAPLTQQLHTSMDHLRRVGQGYELPIRQLLQLPVKLTLLAMHLHSSQFLLMAD